MSFSRTPGGLVEKWRFHNVPTIWVEGPSDIFFYEPITQNLRCRIEPFHGSKNGTALVQALRDHDYPYLVVTDGDYEILSSRPKPHARFLRLRRYSFENYLWDIEPVNRACLRHAKCLEEIDIVGSEMQRVAEHLKKEMRRIVVIDVAARRSSTAPDVLPDHIEQLLEKPAEPNVDPIKIGSIIAKVEPTLEVKLIKKAEIDVNKYLSKHCITHILNGHLLFGVLRRIFLRAAEQAGNAKPSLTNDALIQILSEMIWRRTTSVDHKTLKRQLRGKTRKLASMFQSH